MPEQPELTPEEREALAQFDDFLASAGDAPPLAHPERFDYPVGLDEEGRELRVAGDDDPPGED